MVAEHRVETAAGGGRGSEVSFAVEVGGERMMTRQRWRGEGREEKRGRELPSRSGVVGGWSVMIVTVLLPVLIAFVLGSAVEVSVAAAERLVVVKSFENERDRDGEVAIPVAKWERKGEAVEEEQVGVWKQSGRGMSELLWRRSLTGRGGIGGGGGGGGGKRGGVADAKTRGAQTEVHVEDDGGVVRGLRVVHVEDDRGEKRMRRRRRRKLRFSILGIRRALQVTPDPSQQAAQQARTAPIGQRIEMPDGQGGTVIAVRLNAGDFEKTGYTFNEYQIPPGTVIQGSPGEVVLVYHRSVSSDGTSTSVSVTAYAASNVNAGQDGTQIAIAAPSTSPIIVKVETSDPSQVVTCPGGAKPLPGGGGCEVGTLDQTIVVAPPSSAGPPTLPPPSAIPTSQAPPSVPVVSASTPPPPSSVALPSSLSPSLPPSLPESSVPPSVPESSLSSVPPSVPESSLSSVPPSVPESSLSSVPPSIPESSISPSIPPSSFLDSAPLSSIPSSMAPSSVPPSISSSAPLSSIVSPSSVSPDSSVSEPALSSSVASESSPSSAKVSAPDSSSSLPPSPVDPSYIASAPATSKGGTPADDGTDNNWRVIVGATVGSVLGAIVIVGVILAATRLQQEKKISRMNQATEKGETLQTALVGDSRAPAAPNVRTKAHLETDEF